MHLYRLHLVRDLFFPRAEEQDLPGRNDAADAAPVRAETDRFMRAAGWRFVR